MEITIVNATPRPQFKMMKRKGIIIDGVKTEKPDEQVKQFILDNKLVEDNTYNTYRCGDVPSYAGEAIICVDEQYLYVVGTKPTGTAAMLETIGSVWVVPISEEYALNYKINKYLQQV